MRKVKRIMIKSNGNTVYSLDNIKSAWEKYNQGTVFGVFKDGKWEYPDIIPAGAISGVKAELRKTKEAFTFPEFLEKKWNQ
jgi:hypothetical protein